jgi:hypothetical protein
MEPVETTMTEDQILAKYSNDGLRRNLLPRSTKKLNMEFDENYRHMSKADRDVFLDKHWPE